jgi:hypothetical protein
LPRSISSLVRLGLEEKLQAIPVSAPREQMTFIITAIGLGMASAV